MDINLNIFKAYAMSNKRKQRQPLSNPAALEFSKAQFVHTGQDVRPQDDRLASGTKGPDIPRVVDFLLELTAEIDSTIEPAAPNPYLNMLLHLMNSHFAGRVVSPSGMVAASGVPYATGTRRLSEIMESGLVEQRPRTKSGKSFSLHPSAELFKIFDQFADRVDRIARTHFDHTGMPPHSDDYYFGGSYQAGQAMIPPPAVLPQALKMAGGLRILVHGDPTFMVMANLKRQFEQIIGTDINQRAFSIDRLRHESLRNATRAKSRYDLIAVDLPWLGEFVKKGVIRPLPEVMDIARLDPSDFHTAGWRAAHWNEVPYGVPSQTTPELFFYRRDWFARAGMEPPATTQAVLEAARYFHAPQKGRYGVAWNAARGTALGHTFMMTCADFGQPIIDMAEIAGGYDADHLARDDFRPMLDSPRALEAAEYLVELMAYSPPDILSMSWYERIRPYATGKVAMAYGYTLLAPYFELDPTCPAYGNTGYLPHPHGPAGAPIAPVGGYILCIPANLEEDRLADTVEALVTFTSPSAQKLYALDGSRTAPRYSVGADAEVRRMSPIFEIVDQMSWRDELQFWPRPPIPQISDIIAICGHELHDMLRGITTPRAALAKAQTLAEQALRQPVT